MGILRDILQKPAETNVPARTPPAALHAAVRKLWADHVVWTRQYIVAAVAGAPDADAAAARLLRNQEDIGGAIVPYFGPDAGAALTKLLQEHIAIAVDLVAAAKSGDEAAFARHDARWTRNAEQLADLLSGANPHWPRADVLNLVTLHLTLTKQEAVARLKQDWAADVQAFDDIFVEAMTIADALSDGIVRRFPERFAAA